MPRRVQRRVRRESSTGVSRTVVSIEPTGFSEQPTVGVPLPRKVHVPVRYSEEITYSPGGPDSEAVWQLSSTYDPNTSGTGHQPYGRDQLVTFYNRYRVSRSRFQFQFMNTSSSPCTIVIVPSIYSTNIANADLCKEMPGAIFGMVSGSTGGNPSLTLAASYDHARISGRTKAQFETEETYSSIVSTSPSNKVFVHVYVHSSANITGLATVALVQETDWFELNDLAQS